MESGEPNPQMSAMALSWRPGSARRRCISESCYAGAAALTNFPALVRLSAANGTAITAHWGCSRPARPGAEGVWAGDYVGGWNAGGSWFLTRADGGGGEVNGVGYATLAAALAASAPGQTVTLLTNATIPKSLLSGRSRDIDAGGHVLFVFDDRQVTCFMLK